jgi:two-component system response regulator DesR
MSSTTSVQPILVVDDEPEVVITIDRLLRRAWPLRVASTFAEAIAAIEAGGTIAGAILDVVLPDGSGINLLSLLRDHHPTARVLILTAHAEPELINKAQVCGAEYAVKPHFAESVRAFAARIRADSGDGIAERLRNKVDEYARTHRLSPREAEILQMAVSRVSRDEMASLLRVTLNTLKTETRGLLIKSGAQNLLELAGRIRLDSETSV